MITHPEALGSPITDLDDFVSTRSHSPCEPDPEPSDAANEQSRPGAGRFLWWVGPAIVVALISGWTIGRGTRTAIALPSPPVLNETPNGLMGFAEMYVAAHLTGAGASTMRSFTVDTPAAAVAAYDRYVSRTAATVTVQ